MADASLFGRGVRASARLERIGAHESAEFKAGDTRLNFVCMGHAHPQACALPLDNPPGNPRPAAYTPLLTTVAGCHACGPARAPACRVSVQPCAWAAAPHAGRASRGRAAGPVQHHASVRPPSRVGAPRSLPTRPRSSSELPEREPACPQAGPQCRAVSAASTANPRVVGRARRRRGAARDAPARVPVALPRRAHRRAQRADGRHLHQGQPVGSQRRTRDVARGRLNAADPPSPIPGRSLSRQSPDHLTAVPAHQPGTRFSAWSLRTSTSATVTFLHIGASERTVQQQFALGSGAAPPRLRGRPSLTVAQLNAAAFPGASPLTSPPRPSRPLRPVVCLALSQDFFFLPLRILFSISFYFPSHALDFSHIFPQMCI